MFAVGNSSSMVGDKWSSVASSRRPSVKFDDSRSVVYIPPKEELSCADIWWGEQDYADFRQARWQERMFGLDVASFHSEEMCEYRNTAVELNILIVNNKRGIKSLPTRNFSQALDLYEKEVLDESKDQTNTAGDDNKELLDLSPMSIGRKREFLTKKPIRFSVNQVSHNSKEFALAVGDDVLHYNVIVYCQETSSSCEPPVGDITSQISFPILKQKSQQGNNATCSITVGSKHDDAFLDNDGIFVDERNLLKKIIRSGAALQYICSREEDDMMDRCDENSPYCDGPSSDERNSNDCASKLRNLKRSKGEKCASPVPIPVPRSVSPDHLDIPTAGGVLPPDLQNSSSDSAVKPPHQSRYSLLADHADAFIIQRPSSNSDNESTSSYGSKNDSAIHVTTLSTSDWLRLFRLTTSRAGHPSHSPAAVGSRSSSRRPSSGAASSLLAAEDICMGLLTMELRQSREDVK